MFAAVFPLYFIYFSCDEISTIQTKIYAHWRKAIGDFVCYGNAKNSFGKLFEPPSLGKGSRLMGKSKHNN